MAFAAGTIWHNWSTGATTNGGGFDPTNAGFFADLTTDANTGNTSSPVVSSASYNFAAGDVGAWLFIQSGTNWTPGWYLIASVASNKATLTAGIGTAVLYGSSATGTNYQRPNGLNTAAGVATVGTPTLGVWSIDYSQQTTGIAYTDLVIDGATNTDATSAAKPFGKQQLGNIWNVTGGTGFTVQRVQLTSIPSGVIGRFDKSLGTLGSTGGAATMGGAVGSSSTLTALTLPLVAGNKVFVKATGTYTLTATTTVTAAVKGDTTSGRISVEGFTSYAGQRDGRPVITTATNSVSLFTLNDNDFWEFTHLKLTNTAGTKAAAFNAVTSASSPVWFKHCICDGPLALTTGTQLAIIYLEGCEITNATSSNSAIYNSAGISNTFLYGCDIHDNSCDALRTNSSTTVISAQECLFDTNTIGINITGTTSNNTLTLHNCTFVDNTSDGVKIAATSGTNTLELENNVFYGNGGWGVDNLDEQAVADANSRIDRNNAFGSNTSGARTGVATPSSDITLTADPFVSLASRNFAPNTTAGGGALLRAAAFPTTYPAGTVTSYRDVGAVQHQDSGSGGVTVPMFVLGTEGVFVGA